MSRLFLIKISILLLFSCSNKNNRNDIKGLKSQSAGEQTLDKTIPQNGANQNSSSENQEGDEDEGVEDTFDKEILDGDIESSSEAENKNPSNQDNNSKIDFDREKHCVNFENGLKLWNNGIQDPKKIACFDSMESVFESLPDFLRSNFVLMVDSESAQISSPDIPRIIMYSPWGGIGNYMIAASSDASSKHLEVISWDGNDWRFMGIDFSTSPPTLENSSCVSCHGQPFKAIWGGYLQRPGALDHNGNINGDIEDGSRTKRDLLNQYLADKSSKLKYLKFRDSYQDQNELVAADSNNPKNSKMMMIQIASNLADSYANKILSDPSITDQEIFEFIWRVNCEYSEEVTNNLPLLINEYPPTHLNLGDYSLDSKDPFDHLGESYSWKKNLRISKINAEENYEYLRVSHANSHYIHHHISHILLYKLHTNPQKSYLNLETRLGEILSTDGILDDRFAQRYEETMKLQRETQENNNVNWDVSFFFRFDNAFARKFSNNDSNTCAEIKKIACEQPIQCGI